MGEIIFDEVVQFPELEVGRQFVFVGREQSGVWVKFARPRQIKNTPGRDRWLAGGIPDGVRLSITEGTLRDSERWVRPLRRDCEIQAPECWPKNRP